jgi:hypothetical protein
MWQRTVHILVAGWLMGSLWLVWLRLRIAPCLLASTTTRVPDTQPAAVYEMAADAGAIQRVWGYAPSKRCCCSIAKRHEPVSWRPCAPG